jgi:hypothetical protein
LALELGADGLERERFVEPVLGEEDIAEVLADGPPLAELSVAGEVGGELYRSGDVQGGLVGSEGDRVRPVVPRTRRTA